MSMCAYLNGAGLFSDLLVWHRRANIGTLCMIDQKEGTMNECQKAEVNRLAMKVNTLLQQRIDMPRVISTCTGSSMASNLITDSYFFCELTLCLGPSQAQEWLAGHGVRGS